MTTHHRLTSFGLSHVGVTRQENQDAMLVTSHLFAVADGMGGHEDGADASALAVTAFASSNTQPSDLIRAAHAAIRARVDADRAAGVITERAMGTTGVVLKFSADAVTFAAAWTGDSRLYRFRAGAIERLSHDHSLVQDLIDAGELDPALAATDSRRNIVTHAIGIGQMSALRVDAISGDTKPGDLFILCTDGLSNEVDDQTLEDLAAAGLAPPALSEKLVGLALDNGGRDNVTVVVVKVLP